MVSIWFTISKHEHYESVIKSLDLLFTLTGMPGYMHSDRDVSFMSNELRDYLSQKGVATSKTTPYYQTRNAQIEQFISTIWKLILLAIRSWNVTEKYSELILSKVLHSAKLLLCTSTNTTLQEHFFAFPHHLSHSRSLPSWLMSPGLILLWRFIRNSKIDTYVEKNRTPR